MVRAALIATLIALSPSPAFAQKDDWIYVYMTGTTGAKLMDVCPSIWKPGNYDPCGSYILGVIDGLSIGGKFCPPQGVGNMQLGQLAYNAVKDRPENWDKPAVGIIWNELATRYPCNAPQRK